MNNNQLNFDTETGFFPGEPNEYNTIDAYRSACSILHPKLEDMLKKSVGNLYEEISSDNSGVYISELLWVDNCGQKIGFKLEHTSLGNTVRIQSWDCSDMFCLMRSQFGWFQDAYCVNLTDLLYQLKLRSNKLDALFAIQNIDYETKDDMVNKVLKQMQNARSLREMLRNCDSDLIPDCIAVDLRPLTTVLITGNKPYGLVINMTDCGSGNLVYVLTLWDMNTNNSVWSHDMGYATYAKMVVSYKCIIAEINALFK